MKKYKYNFLTALAAFIFLSGCLKDKYADNQQTNPKVDESIKTAFLLGPSGGPKIVNLTYSTDDTTFGLVTVRVAAEKPVAQDVTVVLTRNTTLIDEYNNTNGTTYAEPDPSLYSIPSLTITIPAGQREANANITLKPIDIATGEYAFGFSIASVSDPSVNISGNFNNQVIIVGVKNRFDGNYTLRIKTVGWDAYGIADGLTGDWPSNSDGTSIFMITSGANSVKFFDNWGFGDFIQVAFTTNLDAATGFGATAPKFIFDLTTNALTDVVNDAAPDPRNRAFMINPAVTDSRYDPVGKKIYAAYIMTQTGRPNQYIYDTLTYVSSR